MKDLEILVLSCDTIEQLPKEVDQLTQLRVLDLRMCFGLKVIPPNTISRLSKLEELYMPYRFNQWQLEGVTTGRSNVSLEELKDLSQLTTLQICIRDAKIVPKGLFLQKLQRYAIHIGANRSNRSNQWNYSGWDKTSRFLIEVPNSNTLELREMNGDKMWHNQLSSMSSCFQNLTDLVISDCCNLKYIFASSTLTSFVQLQCLEVCNCRVLEEIIRIDDLGNNVELPSLKKLSIERCPEIKAFIFGDKNFCSGNIHNFNFPSLEIFVVCDCFKMNIFSSVEASTPMLRKMELDFIIYDCEGDVNTTIQHIQHMHENEPTSTLGGSSMDADDWRNHLLLNSRRRIINKIMDTIKRHFPSSGPDELRKLAVRFEKKIYTCASSQSDYLRRISLKMLCMETKDEARNFIRGDIIK